MSGAGTFSSISANTISGSVCSTSTADVTNAIPNKVVTPALLKSVLNSLPVSLSGTSASFSGQVSAGSLAGGAVVTSRITDFTATGSAVTPAALGLTLAAPPAIGASGPNTTTSNTITKTSTTYYFKNNALDLETGWKIYVDLTTTISTN
jgi:hypothetical protein